MNNKRVLIVGAGFAGMAAAIELQKKGFQTDLIEVDPLGRTDGAGISLHGATLRVFQALDIYQAFLDEGGGSNGFDVLDAHDDHTLMTIPTPIAGDVAFGSAGIMRPALARMLQQRLADSQASIRLGVTFAHIDQDAGGVNVAFSDGRHERYDAVIGADGIHSAVRQLMFPRAPKPAYVGQGVWRAVVDWPAALERPGMWTNGVLKVGINRVSSTQGYVFVTESRATTGYIDPGQFKAHLADLLKQFASPVLGRIADELGVHSQILYRPLFNLLMPRPWCWGRVALIGDAVHSTTPHLAAGACAAMEDAIVLADELSKGTTIAESLSAFEARRWERCRMIVETSARLCEIEITRGDRQEHLQLMRTAMQALAEPI